MRILVAEDDRITRQILESLLTRWGHRVETACDGHETWKRLQAPDAPRLLILDWLMPGPDGLEICRRLRRSETHPPVYVLFVTVKDRKEDVVNGLNAGADDYVAKPFDHEELRARVSVGQRMVELQSSLTRRLGQLEDAMARIRTLEGLLPICSHCHCIRNAHGAWTPLSRYLEEKTNARLSHTVCPQCAETHYPEYLARR